MKAIELYTQRGECQELVYFLILRGCVPGLAELLAPVTIMFVYRPGWGQKHAAAVAESGQARPWPPRPLGLQWSGLSLALFPPLSSSFIFLPGPKPSAVTATIMCLRGREQHSNEVQDLISRLEQTTAGHQRPDLSRFELPAGFVTPALPSEQNTDLCCMDSAFSDTAALNRESKSDQHVSS